MVNTKTSWIIFLSWASLFAFCACFFKIEKHQQKQHKIIAFNDVLNIRDSLKTSYTINLLKNDLFEGNVILKIIKPFNNASINYELLKNQNILIYIPETLLNKQALEYDTLQYSIKGRRGIGDTAKLFLFDCFGTKEDIHIYNGGSAYLKVDISLGDSLAVAILSPGSYYLGNNTFIIYDSPNYPYRTLKVSNPDKGRLEFIRDTLFYIPPENYCGDDRVSYERKSYSKCDYIYMQRDGDVIVILPKEDENTPPIGINDTFYIGNDSKLFFTERDILKNDYDLEFKDFPVYFKQIGEARYGSIQKKSDDFIYTPNLSFVNMDIIPYVINDFGGKMDTAFIIILKR